MLHVTSEINLTGPSSFRPLTNRQGLRRGLVLEIRSIAATRRRPTLETSIVFGQNIKAEFPGIVVKRKPRNR
jgi:hypothetical protein